MIVSEGLGELLAYSNVRNQKWVNIMVVSSPKKHVSCAILKKVKMIERIVMKKWNPSKNKRYDCR